MVATGKFFGNSKFDYETTVTNRLVTSASSGTGTVTLTLCLSPKIPGGIAFNPFVKGDYITVNDVAPWANTNLLDLNPLWKVIEVIGSTVKFARPGVASGQKITTGLNAVVEKRDASTVSLTKPYGDPVTEIRKLSTMFYWDTDLAVTSTMCAMQRRLRDMLTKFWNSPEVVRNYKRNWTLNKSSWTGYGPQGGWDATKFVNATMCILYGSSRWNKQCVDGLDGLCDPWGQFSLYQLDDKRLGLWQLTPSQTIFAPWNSQPSWGSDLVTDTWFHAEYESRAALWLFWRRIMSWNGADNLPFNITDPLTFETSNPFRWLPKAQWNPSTLKWVDSAVQTCWGSGCSKCPPYGSTSCVQ